MTSLALLRCFYQPFGDVRALCEGEAAFEHSCRLLRDQSDLKTQVRNTRMVPTCTKCFESGVQNCESTKDGVMILPYHRPFSSLKSVSTEQNDQQSFCKIMCSWSKCTSLLRPSSLSSDSCCDTTSNTRASLASNFVQAKIDRMAEEAAAAEKSAIEVLREVEEQGTAQELWRAKADLERDGNDAEAELKRHLHVRR